MPFSLHLHQPSESSQRKKDFEWYESLGSGSYGKVTKCSWKTRNPPIFIAMKVVPKSKIKRSKESYTKGVHILTNLNHPNILVTHDAWEGRSNWYIVLELAQGGELYGHVERAGRFSESDARPIVRNLLSGLSYLKSNRIMHRDLKLENVFVRNQAPPFECVVADFGVSRYFEESERMEGNCLWELIGSPGYMAPEILKKVGYGIEADMWSFGVITFLILAGRFPFVTTLNREFLQHVDKGLNFPSREWKETSHEARAFCRFLLNPDPSKRATPEEALKHKWLNDEDDEKLKLETIKTREDSIATLQVTAEKTRRVSTLSTKEARLH